MQLKLLSLAASLAAVDLALVAPYTRELEGMNTKLLSIADGYYAHRHTPGQALAEKGRADGDARRVKEEADQAIYKVYVGQYIANRADRRARADVNLLVSDARRNANQIIANAYNFNRQVYAREKAL